MQRFQPPKLRENEIEKGESMVHGRLERTKKFPSTLLPNELVLLNYNKVKNQQEIFNLIDNHAKKEEMGTPRSGKNSMIFYFVEPKRAVSIGRQLSRAFKKSKIAIKWSKVDKEVKVYVDFSNV